METLLTDKLLTKEHIHFFKTRALMFYIEACDQVVQRFPLKNNPLRELRVFEPENVKKGNLPTIVSICRNFPILIKPTDFQKIDTEWRLLRNTNEIQKFDNNSESFWMSVSELRTGDNSPMFENVCDFVFKLLSLPHSSANVERIFSAINLIKTKQRMRLVTKSIVGLLYAKAHIEGQNCYDFDLNVNLIKKMSNEKWYVNKDNTDP